MMSAEPAPAPVVDETKAKRKAEAERKKAEERAKKLEERRAKVQLPLPVIMSTELSGVGTAITCTHLCSLCTHHSFERTPIHP